MTRVSVTYRVCLPVFEVEDGDGISLHKSRSLRDAGIVKEHVIKFGRQAHVKMSEFQTGHIEEEICLN